MAGKAPTGKRIVMRRNAPKESESMNNIFHQTDETFFETQYCHGFSTHVPLAAGTMRPSSAAIDSGAQMKSLMENESKPLKEQYREVLHQQHHSQQGRIGGSRFLRTVDSLAAVKNLTHGTKSRVENNFSSLIFPGCSDTGTVPVRRTHSDDLGDTWHTMTHGKRTNSDRNGGCFWKILNHDTASSSTMANDVAGEKKEEISPAIEKKSSSLQPKNDAITQQEEHQDNAAVNQALQYLQKLRPVFSQSGAIRTTRDELTRASVDEIGDYDWNVSLLKQVGTGETLDYGVLDPLLRTLEIDPKTREGFVRLLDLLDDEIPLTKCELG